MWVIYLFIAQKMIKSQLESQNFSFFSFPENNSVVGIRPEKKKKTVPNVAVSPDQYLLHMGFHLSTYLVMKDAKSPPHPTPNELCPVLVSGLTVQPCEELRCSAAGF